VKGSRRPIATVVAALVVASLAFPGVSCAEQLRYRITGDAIAEPIDGKAGNAERGRRVVLDRNVGNCLICHAVPEPAERFMGDIGPDLAGVGARLSRGQIRLRLVDAALINPQTVMPPYYRTEGLVRVGAPWRGKTVLTSEQIEDVVAYLDSLTTSP
jgi:sulfur-oxidizing protein SoxX